MHIFNIPQQVCKVSKRSIKNCGRSWLHKLYIVKHDEQTDRQMEGQTGANLKAPWLWSRGHKYSWLLSAAVVIGALRVKVSLTFQKEVFIIIILHDWAVNWLGPKISQCPQGGCDYFNVPSTSRAINNRKNRTNLHYTPTYEWQNLWTTCFLACHIKLTFSESLTMRLMT